MKKIKLIFSILLPVLILIFTNNVYARAINLNDIKDTFNNSDTIKSYKDFGYELTADLDSDNSNILVITLTTNDGSTTISYELHDNILTNEHLVDNEVISAYFLADVIGQLNGYQDGELLNNFNLFTDEISNYTIDNEGFEVKENENYYIAKLDITKEVPLVDVSKFYLKPEQFDTIKEMVKENITGNQSGRIGTFAYNLEVRKDENTIYIGELDEATENTYKSIISALSVMYDEKVVDYFKSKYPKLEDGIYFYDGLTIETDTFIDYEEEPMYEGMIVTKVEIDNQYVKDEIMRTEYIGETIDYGDKNITLDFIKDKSYKVGFFDNAKSTDAAFLYKYILEPVFMEQGLDFEGDTVYFNIVSGKIVVGDSENSIFKIVINFDENYFELLPTNMEVAKNEIIANHPNTLAKEYEEGKGMDHYRFGNYNVMIKVIYGIEDEKITYELLDKKVMQGGEISFRFNILYSKFLEDGKVYVDGELVDKSNYTSEEGSTIIKLNKDYVKNLTNGEHTLKVVVSDGEASTLFNTVNEITSPKTGDTIMSYIYLLIVSMLGLLGTIFYSKKYLKGKYK